jgi:hypothetical protein
MLNGPWNSLFRSAPLKFTYVPKIASISELHSKQHIPARRRKNLDVFESRLQNTDDASTYKE